jgi:DNA-binding NarL/FixJ family response regulator
MAVKEANACKGPARGLPPATEALIRKLVAQAGPRRPVTAVPPTHAAPTREVLFAAEVDGVRCLLFKASTAPAAQPALSPREQEIARLIAKGFPNKAIAAVLDISVWTVCTHLRRIFAKVGVTSRAAMVARIMDSGMPL